MNLFKINFLEKTTRLMKEALKFKKYKAMPIVVAVFVGLFMFPFMVWGFFLWISLLLITFVFKVIISPINYLHSILTNEAKQISAAAQFVIYFISWPLVFSYYSVVAFILIAIYIQYALLSIINYLWTLGGFKFHVFIDREDDISIEVNEKYNIIPILVYLIISGCISVLIPLIHGIVLYADLYQNYQEAYFNLGYVTVYSYIQTVFTIIYGYSVLCLRPKMVEQVELNIEEPKEE